MIPAPNHPTGVKIRDTPPHPHHVSSVGPTVMPRPIHTTIPDGHNPHDVIIPHPTLILDRIIMVMMIHIIGVKIVVIGHQVHILVWINIVIKLPSIILIPQIHTMIQFGVKVMIGQMNLFVKRNI